MKIALLTCLLISSSTFAQNLDVTEALLSIFPAGKYVGTSPSGENCDVTIAKTGFGISVTASTQKTVVIRNIFHGTTYRWNPANRSFLSSDLTSIPGGKHESTFRTIAVENDTQYVVVSDRLDSSHTGHNEFKVECVVDL